MNLFSKKFKSLEDDTYFKILLDLLTATIKIEKSLSLNSQLLKFEGYTNQRETRLGCYHQWSLK